MHHCNNTRHSGITSHHLHSVTCSCCTKLRHTFSRIRQEQHQNYYFETCHFHRHCQPVKGLQRPCNRSGAWLSILVAGVVSHIFTSWVLRWWFCVSLLSGSRVSGSVSMLVQVGFCAVMVWVNMMFGKDFFLISVVDVSKKFGFVSLGLVYWARNGSYVCLRP
ncbi:hypothetical protein KC19_1G162200 [Ceratodon purpureus]|uniref:Transmembrane protein n=1 Tax=Ceratodon purpureus TaxID=3225 RepID=A0A8T0J7Q4_CERPU|nr:hypothetical protein KC19_1G162200 [Ceratodon purpureus]